MRRGFPRFHPRAWWDAWRSYPRYLGTLKPKLLEEYAEQEYLARLASFRKGWWPKQIRVPLGERILALSAHPDDETIGAGGLLLAHRGRAQIHLAVVCDGRGGGAVATRKGEWARVARALGAASTQALDFPDGAVPATQEAAKRLGALVEQIQPDLVLLPWFLDGQPDHRRANLLYAWGCAQLPCTVLAYEIWTLLEPNAVLDITDRLEEKLRLLETYESQLAGIDYLQYATGLAKVRAFQQPVRPDRGGAAEAFLALPNREYCDLVCGLYGPPGALREAARPLLK